MGLDKNLRIISANQSFFTTFKVNGKDTIRQLLPDLGNRQWNIPDLLVLLKEIIPEKKVVKDYEVDHKFPQIGERIILLNACQFSVHNKIAEIIVSRGIEEGEEELILLAFEDVTEQKRLQEKLKNSEERFHGAFDTARDGLLLVQKNKGTILNSNESAQELLEYSQDELLEMNLWEIVITEDFKGFQDMSSILERDGIAYLCDSSIKTQKGLSIRSDIFITNRSKVIQCNIRDITERKKSENQILNLAKFPEENSNPVLRLKEDGEILFSNAAGEVILEAWGTAIKGKAPSDWITIMEDAFQDNMQMTKELETDGVTYFFVVAPVIENGYVNLYGLDITEKKKSDEELNKYRNHFEDLVKERTIKLEEEVIARRKGEEEIRSFVIQLLVANNELEAFNYSVSRDLRAPLRSMDGFSRILLETCKDKLDAEAKDNLMRVRKASQRMAQLIDDLLTLSKVTCKELKKKRVNLSGIGELILSDLKKQDKLRHMEVIPITENNCTFQYRNKK